MNKKNTNLEHLFYHFEEIKDPRAEYSIQLSLFKNSTLVHLQANGMVGQLFGKLMN